MTLEHDIHINIVEQLNSKVVVLSIAKYLVG